MSDRDLPQIYLITPPAFEINVFPDLLAGVLDRVPVGCVRLALAARDADVVARAADAVREVAHARDVALVIAEHIGLVDRLGLDGVHLGDGARTVRKARKELGAEPIVGAFCGASRHEGMTAGEAGADYVAFGPAGKTGLGDGTVAEAELFSWWSEMIELPVVAEGGLDADLIRSLAPATDFFGIGPEIWGADDPGAALALLDTALRAG